MRAIGPFVTLRRPPQLRVDSAATVAEGAAAMEGGEALR